MAHSRQLLGAFFLLLLPSVSFSYTIGALDDEGTDVGGVDTLVETIRAMDDNTYRTVKDYVADFTGLPVNRVAIKFENVPFDKSHEDEDVIAFRIGTGTKYYIVVHSRTWATYENTKNRGWAVLDTSAWPSSMKLTGKKIRLIRVFTDTSLEIPPE